MLPFQFYSKVVTNINIDNLESEIPFSREKINSNGEWIPESRLTCWMSDDNTTLEYSDKEMEPIRLTEKVSEIRDILNQKFGIYFDSVLANYYSDNSVGMRYHSDPLGDNKWDPNFMIVSFGSDRKLIFREIKNVDIKYPFEMSNGDMVHMFDDCQDTYQHSVRRVKTKIGPRISLVFKKSIKK